MFGLGKTRTKLGKWLDQRGIKQDWLCKEGKLNKTTVSHLATKPDYLPTGSTMKKVLQALRKVDPNVKQDDFWSM
ncbi:transcriptional regulator (plasmid) [Brevibacillus sp. HD3.3A]|nr:transcriptional regulator [Brevibacillus sp. HD3.3A]UED72167.1 transcriptional regulator [Brevibacillus sp. HD3.3A]